jgi:hypothetical protein
MSGVSFNLNIFEIPGKNTVSTYINTIKSKLSSLNIQFEIIENNKNNISMPSVEEISQMDEGTQQSTVNSLLSSIGLNSTDSSEVLNQEAIKSTPEGQFQINGNLNNVNDQLVSITIIIRDDFIEKSNYFGVHQFDTWLLRRETEKNNVCI